MGYEKMRTLVIIFGQVRTLSTCIQSIYDNILYVNSPCHCILAIDGKFQDIPNDVIHLLNPYIYDIFTTHNHDDDEIKRDHQSIEFSLVNSILSRINPDKYQFILKIRTDIYIRHPINLKIIYGLCSGHQFKKAFLDFIQHTKIHWKTQPFEAIQAWFLTGGLSFFISKQLDKDNPPVSPWSISNVYEWNAKLFKKLEMILERVNKDIDIPYIQFLIRTLSKDDHILYLIGSTWIHFGLTMDVLNVSQKLHYHHTTMKWSHLNDDDVMEWTDHKNEVRKKCVKEWRNITDDQIRMVHHLNDVRLMDLVNPNDYIESFDARHSFKVNKKDSNLFAFIVRPHQLDKNFESR